MPELSERVSALESIFAKVNLGDWSNDQDVPWWLAIRIRHIDQQLQASLVSAVHLVAQAKLNPSHGSGVGVVGEIIDDWCGTRPRPFPPRPHWGSIVEQLGQLAERYSAGSALRDASLELCHLVINRVREQNRPAK
jgi:hypothetical protein